MISILPLADRERKDRILKAIPGAESNAEILVMCDKEEELGFVAVDVKASTVRILKIEESGSSSEASGVLLADSLMKAAASYGANMGAYRIESCIPEFKEYFQSCGFRLTEGKLLSPLGNFVKICRH